MKTINLLRFAAFVFCIALALNMAKAEDFVFKTVLVKTVSKSITPAAYATCDGSPAPPSTPINYDVTEVMKTPGDFTALSIKVFYSDDLNTVKYSFLNLTPAGVNFNSATGEISYTMTGITQTRKKLTARLYLNGTGSDPKYQDQDFYTSLVGDNPPIGSIIPYYGSNDAGTTTKLNLGGWFFCDGSSISSVSDDVLFPAEKATLTGIVGSNFPDLRGLFLRGAGANSYDPSSPRAIGSVQTEDAKFIAHHYEKTNATTGYTDIGLGYNNSATFGAGAAAAVISVGASNGNHTHSISTSNASTTNPGGGVETRPDNVAVYYLIKAR